MRVLVIGAGGRFGSRLLPALLSAGHVPIAFVRDKVKLESMLPAEATRGLTILQGDAESPVDVRRAIEETKCDVFVNAAGSPSRRDGKGPASNQGRIGMNVLNVCKDLHRDTGRAVRGWWVQGFAFLDDPLQPGVVHDRIPDFRPEHRPVGEELRKTPLDVVKWSILCPSWMKAASTTVLSPSQLPREGASTIKFSKNVTMAQGRPIMWFFRAMMTLKSVWKGFQMMGILALVLWHKVAMEDLCAKLVKELDNDEWLGVRVGSCTE